MLRALFFGGVFYYVRRGVPAWLFFCRLCPALSHVAGLLRFVLFVVSAIVWCAFRECSYCDVVHASLCGCTFDGDRGCRLSLTV